MHVGGKSLSPEIGFGSMLSVPEVKKDTHRIKWDPAAACI